MSLVHSDRPVYVGRTKDGLSCARLRQQCFGNGADVAFGCGVKEGAVLVVDRSRAGPSEGRCRNGFFRASERWRNQAYFSREDEGRRLSTAIVHSVGIGEQGTDHASFFEQ